MLCWLAYLLQRWVLLLLCYVLAFVLVVITLRAVGTVHAVGTVRALSDKHSQELPAAAQPGAIAYNLLC